MGPVKLLTTSLPRQAPSQPSLASFQSIQSPATPPWLANAPAVQHQISELPDLPVVQRHRQVRTVGTAAELSRQPYPSPRLASSVAAGGDPILGGELVIRVIDAQVSPKGTFTLLQQLCALSHVNICRSLALTSDSLALIVQDSLALYSATTQQRRKGDMSWNVTIRQHQCRSAQCPLHCCTSFLPAFPDELAVLVCRICQTLGSRMTPRRQRL